MLFLAVGPRPCDVEQRSRALIETAGGPLRSLRPMTDAQPVQIADNVRVRFDSVVVGGVSIGHDAITGCKTVITEDVPPYAIVVGNPYRILRFLGADDTEEARTAGPQEFALISETPLL